MRVGIFLVVTCMLPTLARADDAAATWQGYYLGGNLGYARGHLDADFSPPSTYTGAAGSSPQADAGLAALPVASLNLSDGGFTGGIQTGYNYRINGIVAGLELDFSAMKLQEHSTDVGFSDPVHLWSDTVETSFNTDWLLTLRPRIGVPFGNALLYVTGGLAVTRINVSQTQTSVDLLAGVPGYSETVSEEKTKAGWTLGGGVEMALGPNWSVKGEYLYSDFGTIKTTGLTEGPSAYAVILGAPFAHEFELNTSVFRAGLNYHF